MTTEAKARYTWAGRVGKWLLDLLFATVRLDCKGEEAYLRFRRQGGNVIFALWHGRLLPLTYHHRHEGVVALVSEHADGEYITRIIENLGYDTVRGSSTRGAVPGLRGLVRAARAGHDLAITPDGPQGPRGKVKTGALVVAQISGRPIIPVSAGCTRAWWPGSWDRFLVPKPFSHLSILYGEPIFVARDATDAEVERAALRLQEELDRITSFVDEAAGSVR
ncbi:MAG: lysophospholipid acyltransferase family protein [Gemmatimonadetes bacterium]|nr:lysophospholipid acyltransferase family protein [Gemmatimonadota bacterium]